MNTIKKTLLGLSLLMISCTAKKSVDNISSTPVTKVSGISETDKNIINDFLKAELIKDRYQPYKNYPISIIKEELGKLHSLKIYEYCYTDRNLPLKSSTNKDWIIDAVQIKKIQEMVKSDSYHDWEVSDFTAFNITILESGELIRSIKESTYIKLPSRLIIYLSTPLKIDENNALISINLGDSSLGFSTINRFTALLKSGKNGKWEIDSYYYDPNSTW